MLFEKIEKGAEDIVFVYTICGSVEEARSLGYSAVEEKLAISMDYWGIHSIYPWQNIIQEVDQYILMFSTQKKISSKLVKHVESLHSYDIPMIVVTHTDMTNAPYSLWVDDTLNSEEKYMTEEEAHPKKDISSLSDLK